MGAFAQVPKAYQNEYYRATLSGHRVTFILADGYISYSKIKFYPGKKPVVFEAASAVADTNGQLKFMTYRAGRRDYFVIDSLEEGYDNPPRYFAGRYFANGKSTLIKFKRTRHR